MMNPWEITVRRRALAACLALLATQSPTAAQRATGFDNPYFATATEVTPETLVPAVRKWYLPQRLYSLYDWRQDRYSNYARDPYQRYNDVFLEGSPFYDVYGNYITQGWRVYEWTERYPVSNGSNVYKDPRFSSWFNNVLISSSHSGQFHTSLMVGDAIRTTLTPLTFSKPRFDGLQWDISTDKYSVTALASRINNSGSVGQSEVDASVQFTTFTNLWALRGQTAIGDFATLGATVVNAAHMNSDLPFGDASFKGLLSGPMNSDFVRTIIVRISDDSPEDGEGGAQLSRWRIFINGVEHTEDIVPVVDGGIVRRGVREASGTDVITLTFNIEDFTPTADDEIDDFREAESVEIGLVLANDYRVEVTSNKQTDQLGAPVFLPVLRAPGNVKDGSNQVSRRFRYGLPTGNRLLGIDLRIADVAGFDLHGEYVRNFQYRRFPNENFTIGQDLAQDEAEAFYVTAQRRRYPWTLYGEVYSTDPNYSTRAFIPNSEGEVFYDNEQVSVYEFVDDNDDQDELPDWNRKTTGPRVNTRQGRGLSADNAVFPGIDENNDDLSDFNRNFNREPDYAEPFLRYEVDPPEFLFGMDMNNNTVIDRFENDDEADYPYRVGRRGYNAYAGVEIAPGTTVMAGHLDERLLKTARDSRSTYVLLTAEKDLPRRGLRLRLMANPRLVHDDIPDDVFLWVDTPGTLGEARFTRDPLAARNAFVNSTYLDLRYDRGLSLEGKVKHEIFRQRGAAADLQRDQTFFGFITKGEYPIQLRAWSVRPRWKQLYSSAVPVDRDAGKTRELTEILSVLASRQVTQNMAIMGGVEYEVFRNLRPRPEIVPQGFLDDSNTWILAGQVANRSAYLGYDMTMNVGVRWEREDIDSLPEAATRMFTFVNVFAGLGTQ
jgi:hypothetical protein